MDLPIPAALQRRRDISSRPHETSGLGEVEVGDLPAQHVRALDVVWIPAGCRQRIRNTGREDLVFLAICSPRFVASAYEDIEDQQR